MSLRILARLDRRRAGWQRGRRRIEADRRVHLTRRTPISAAERGSDVRMANVARYLPARIASVKRAGDQAAARAVVGEVTDKLGASSRLLSDVSHRR